MRNPICPRCGINKRTNNPNIRYCRECESGRRGEYNKKTKYRTEKTPSQRKIRYIKRRTRMLYPLKGHNCEFCGEKATEHHHNTKPIEVDKFNYVCHSCHVKNHRKSWEELD